MSLHPDKQELLLRFISKSVQLTYAQSPQVATAAQDHRAIAVLAAAEQKYTVEQLEDFTIEMVTRHAVWAHRFSSKEEAYEKLFTDTEPRSYPEPGVSDQLDEFLSWLNEVL